MARNILLTSLSAAEKNLPFRFFSVPNEFGFDYCDALLDAEAGIKALLGRYNIDDIIIIGDPRSYDDGDDLKPISLCQGSALCSREPASLSTYGLLQYRIARFANELPTDMKAEDARLPEDAREKLIRFIQDFQEGNDALKTKKLNRLFDALAQSDPINERFWDALFETYPELRDRSSACVQWVKSYLYAALKPSAKLELLPVNENARMRFIPETQIEDSAQWVDSAMAMEKNIVEDAEDINLYVSLNSDDASDTFVLMNMLDILVSRPGSVVHLKHIFTVRGSKRGLTGVISDDTYGFGVTELIHAIRAFLNYGKADMIVDIWEKSSVRNESISSMVYAMRHVDVGLSMCNMSEVESGILRLRKLFRDERLWREFGYYGMLFSVIAESIQADYGTLLEGDADIPFIDLVKWAYRHQFYQQTLTLIESRAPEYLVKTGMFYYCDDEKQAEQVTRLFAQERLALKPHEYYKMDQIDHYFIKTYDRIRSKSLCGRGEDPQRAYAALRAQSVENKNDALITGFTACDSRETLQNLLFSYYHIGNIRNKISHADADAMGETRLIVSESDESSALIQMKDGIDYFIACYEKALAEVRDKNPNVVFITADTVRATADRMKYQRPKTN